MPAQARPVEVFLSYAPEDEALLLKLENHLSTLRRDGLIRSFHAGNVIGGQAWKAVTEAHLETRKAGGWRRACDCETST